MREFGGSWSESKLDCVEDYARSYLRVMQNQSWSLDYVDAFAGRGKQALRMGSAALEMTGAFFEDESEREDANKFFVGSAIRALRASIGSVRRFDRFQFIDTDSSSCHELSERVRSEFPTLESSVSVVCEDANQAIGEYVDSVDWKKTRALVFLDPYGLDVGWGLIDRLAATRACDVWYLFPLSTVVRMMGKSGKIPPAWEAGLDRVFGTHDWRTEFYRPNPQQSLLPLDENPVRDASTDHVVAFLQNRLATVFAAVSNAGILRNSKDSPLFALVLGVSNPSPAARTAALRIANHLVKELNQP
jgi:three-Cys-motif partner protein